MLTARRSRLFEQVFRVYNRNLLRRRFEGLRVAGLEHLRERELPVVLYANHSSWWDGLVACEIGLTVGAEQYVMMEERQLRAYPLFRRLGAFSIDNATPRAQMRSVEYAASLLRGDHRAGGGVRTPPVLWIFPQGRIRPNDLRPLDFRQGTAHIVRRAGSVRLLPVALRYEHLGDFRPEAVARIGAGRVVTSSETRDARSLTAEMEAALTKTLDRVRADVLAGGSAEYLELVAERRRGRKPS